MKEYADKNNSLKKKIEIFRSKRKTYNDCFKDCRKI